MGISRLRGLDLFSGIGGNTLGLRDYIKTIAYCEADRHAQSVLLSRMDDGSIEPAPIWDDIQTLKGGQFNVGIDIIVGGFPCQDISVAGHGVGLGGERSGLFFEIMRLAEEIKPPFLFLENVPAIRTRGLDRVLEELTKAGYDSRWCMLSAAEIGALHKRERWFLLAYANRQSIGHQSENKRSDNGEVGQRETFLGNYGSEKFMADSSCERCGEAGRLRYEQSAQRTSSSSEEKRVANTDCKSHQRLPKREGTEQSIPRIGSVDENNLAFTEIQRIQGLRPSRQQVSDSYGQEGLSLCESQRSSSTEGDAESNLDRMVDGISYGLDNGLPDYLRSSYWEKEPEVARVTEDKTQRAERLKRIGNAVVPLQSRIAFERLWGL